MTPAQEAMAQRILMLPTAADGGRELTPEIVADLQRHHGFSTWNLTPDMTLMVAHFRPGFWPPIYRFAICYWSAERIQAILLGLGWL